ncbi:MAG: hypothetical protein RLZZ361_938 [Cyanobacteriota bacterium]|jgi:hypothetical protein
MLRKRLFLILNKTLALFVLANLSILCPLMVQAQEVYKAKIEIMHNPGFHFQLVPETLVDTSLSLEGDYFSAFLTKPSAELLKLPLGSRLLGQITEVQEPKNFGRSAKLVTHINQIMLPDGRTIKVSADLSSKTSMQDDEKPQASKNLVKKITKDSLELSSAGLVGAVDAVQYTGIGTAIMTSGLSVAIGGALGLGMGVFGLATNKGEELISSGFDPVSFKLESEFEFLESIPDWVVGKAPVNLAELGLDMKVSKIKKASSNIYGDYLLLDIELKNNSFKKVHFGDFVLSSNRHFIPVYNNPLISSESLSGIETNTTKQINLAFSLGSIKKSNDYKLMMIDPISQEIVAYIDVQLASFI